MISSLTPMIPPPSPLPSLIPPPSPCAPTSKGLTPPLLSLVFVSSSPLQLPPSSLSVTMSWRAASAVHMERALLERCPNTLLRRRAAEALKPQVQPRIAVTDLALSKPGLRPIVTSVPVTPISGSVATSASHPCCYTSLAEIIPTPGSPLVERVTSPRTPMRNRLVEKAARAYLLPSDSFNKRHSQSAPWTQSFSRFLPRLSVLTMALNPFNAFSSAFQVFRFYLTGARALQPQFTSSVSRSVSRSTSMPIQRYTHDLSIR